MIRDEYIAWALVATLLSLCVSLVSIAANHHGDLTRAIRVGSLFYQRAGVAELYQGSRPTIWSSHGFDGQFFLALGHDPFLRSKAIGNALDAPHFRARRILYPLAGRLIESKRTSVSFGLLVVTYFSFLAMNLCAAALLRDRQANPLLVFVVSLSPSLLHAAETFTCEVLATALLFMAFYSSYREQRWSAWLCLAMAMLTKETSALIVIAFALTSGWRKSMTQCLFWLSSLLPFALWYSYLSFALADPSLPLAGLKNVGVPFIGWLGAMTNDLSTISSGESVIIPLLLVASRGWFMAAALYAIGHCFRQLDELTASAALAGVLAIMLTSGQRVPAYDVARNFARQLYLLPPLLFLLHVRSASPWTRKLILALMALSAWTAYTIMAGRISF